MESIRLQLELDKMKLKYSQQRLFLTTHIDHWIVSSDLEIAVSTHDMSEFVILDVIEYYQIHRHISLVIEAQTKLQDNVEIKLYIVASVKLDENM
jgi:hypothetical protein